MPRLSNAVTACCLMQRQGTRTSTFTLRRGRKRFPNPVSVKRAAPSQNTHNRKDSCCLNFAEYDNLPFAEYPKAHRIPARNSWHHGRTVTCAWGCRLTAPSVAEGLPPELFSLEMSPMPMSNPHWPRLNKTPTIFWHPSKPLKPQIAELKANRITR